MSQLISPCPSPPPTPAPNRRRVLEPSPPKGNYVPKRYQYDGLFHIPDIAACGVTQSKPRRRWPKQDKHGWWDDESDEDLELLTLPKSSHDDEDTEMSTEPTPVPGSPSFSRPITLPTRSVSSPAMLLPRPAPRGKAAEKVILNAAQHAQLQAEEIHLSTPTFNEKLKVAGFDTFSNHRVFEPRYPEPPPSFAGEGMGAALRATQYIGCVGDPEHPEWLPWGESQRNWTRYRTFEKAWRVAKRNVRLGVGVQGAPGEGKKSDVKGKEKATDPAHDKEEGEVPDTLESLLTLVLYVHAARRTEALTLPPGRTTYGLDPYIFGSMDKSAFGNRGLEEGSSDEEDGIPDRLTPHRHSQLFYFLVDMYNDTEFGAVNRARLEHWGLLARPGDPIPPPPNPTLNPTTKAPTTATVSSINALGWSASLTATHRPSKHVTLLPGGPEEVVERAEEVVAQIAAGGGKGKKKDGGAKAKGKATKSKAQQTKAAKAGGNTTTTKKGKGKAAVDPEPEPAATKGRKGKGDAAAEKAASSSKPRGRGRARAQKEEEEELVEQETLDTSDVNMDGYEERVWLTYVRAPSTALPMDDPILDDAPQEDDAVRGPAPSGFLLRTSEAEVERIITGRDTRRSAGVDSVSPAKKNTKKNKVKIQERPGEAGAESSLAAAKRRPISPAPTSPRSQKRSLELVEGETSPPEPSLPIQSTPLPESPKKRRKVHSAQPDAGPSSSPATNSDNPSGETLRHMLTLLAPSTSPPTATDLPALRALSRDEAEHLLGERQRTRKEVEKEVQEAYKEAEGAVEELVGVQRELERARRGTDL